MQKHCHEEPILVLESASISGARIELDQKTGGNEALGGRESLPRRQAHSGSFRSEAGKLHTQPLEDEVRDRPEGQERVSNKDCRAYPTC